jgi:hypothetical protein
MRLYNKVFIAIFSAAILPLLGGVVFADYEDLVKTCLDFLSCSEDRRCIAEAGFKLMSQRSEMDYLKNVLKKLN